MNGSVYTERLAAVLLTLFAALAVLVATVGIYGGAVVLGDRAHARNGHPPGE